MNQESPQSPAVASPCSPVDGRSLKIQSTSSLPPLITTFPINSAFRRNSAVQFACSNTPISARNRLELNIDARKGSVPSISSSMDVEIITPSSAYSRRVSLPYLGLSTIDGRQSRMDVRSPIIEQVVALPLRLNTIIHESSPVVEAASQTEFHPSSLPTSFDGPKTARQLSHSRSPAISRSSTFPTTLFSTSYTMETERRTRSPIRKRTSSPRTSRTASRPRQQSRSGSRPRHHNTDQARSRTPRPPKYHVTVSQNRDLNHDKPKIHPSYPTALAHLSTPLVPLISVSSGLPHPQFPRSLLQYHLLTHEQLDSLAKWYHQVEPAMEETWRYPTWIPAWTGAKFEKPNDTDEEMVVVDLETKRRRWGRFMGLRGCESPNEVRNYGVIPSQRVTREEGAVATENKSSNAGGESSTTNQELEKQQREEEQRMVQRMERKWRDALRKAEEEEMLRDKTWRGRW